MFFAHSGGRAATYNVQAPINPCFQICSATTERLQALIKERVPCNFLTDHQQKKYISSSEIYVHFLESSIRISLVTEKNPRQRRKHLLSQTLSFRHVRIPHNVGSLRTGLGILPRTIQLGVGRNKTFQNLILYAYVISAFILS